jgi:drug/metabolite transporter superfamily protein YnfA
MWRWLRDGGSIMLGVVAAAILVVYVAVLTAWRAPPSCWT